MKTKSTVRFWITANESAWTRLNLQIQQEQNFTTVDLYVFYTRFSGTKNKNKNRLQ